MRKNVLQQKYAELKNATLVQLVRIFLFRIFQDFCIIRNLLSLIF